MLKHGILGLLNYGSMTGYEIMDVFRDSLSHFWVAQTSQIYRELQTIEKKGWATSEHVEQDSKPDKNVFSITEAGKLELYHWLQDDQLTSNIRSPMLMKTFFRGECTIEENIEFFRELAERVSVFPGGNEAADQAKLQYEQQISDPKRAIFWKFTIVYGMMYEKMVKEWCEYCIKELEVLRDE
ncbi:MAG: PadR family transcriptional regulator [Lachnospiraceae bacterium]|nr:PadR family transcriptional regulator [Lachnospiraceae bacterium]